MRPRIHNLIEKLEAAGFVLRGAEASHMNYRHPAGINITIPGQANDIAKHYLIFDVINALYLIYNE
jgi:predicted RNA binding protein YcfA (HicA-like mRNA interferase family)